MGYNHRRNSVCRATVGTPRLLFFVLQYFPPRGTRRPLREAKSSCWHIIMFLYLLCGSSVVAFVVALSGRPLPCPTCAAVFPPGLFADSVSHSHACLSVRAGGILSPQANFSLYRFQFCYTRSLSLSPSLSLSLTLFRGGGVLTTALCGQCSLSLSLYFPRHPSIFFFVSLFFLATKNM